MPVNSKFDLVIVTGPTATGKTRFAALVADKIAGEIISADSRQVYRRMDLGTGKDYKDYEVSGRIIPHHLIDIREPGEKYNVFEFQKDFFEVYNIIKNNNKIPILCGGTGMYIEAVTKGYKLIAVPVNEALREKLKDKSLPELEEILATYKKLHNKTDTDTKKRAIRAIEIQEYYLHQKESDFQLPVLKPVYFGIQVDRETRRKRITTRLKKRLENGMIDEVKSILEEGISPDDLIYYGLEYKFITLYLTNQIDYKTMVYKLNIAIHQFAKRQMTWFRKMEREGIDIRWIDGKKTDDEKTEDAIKIIRGE